MKSLIGVICATALMTSVSAQTKTLKVGVLKFGAAKLGTQHLCAQ